MTTDEILQKLIEADEHLAKAYKSVMDIKVHLDSIHKIKEDDSCEYPYHPLFHNMISSSLGYIFDSKDITRCSIEYMNQFKKQKESKVPIGSRRFC